MKCVRCGFEISDPSMSFCTACGLPVGPAPEAGVPVVPVVPTDVVPVVPVVPTDAAPVAPAAPDLAPMAPAPDPVPENTYATSADPYAGGAPQPAYGSGAVDPYAPVPYPGAAPMPPAPVASLCGRCGAPVQAGAPFCTGCGAPAQPPMPIPAPKKKLGKGARAAIISIVSLVVLVGGLFAAFLIIRPSQYEKAVEAMNSGQYQEAQDAFESWILSNFKDSAENAEYCRQMLVYEQAIDAFDREDYMTAADLFGQISGFQDADLQKEYCEGLAEGIGYFNAGQYWKAYDVFSSLYGDEAEIWMDQCVQTPPDEGIMDEGPAYATGPVELKIDSWTLKDIIFAIYKLDGEYWGSVYIEGLSDFTVSLPAGTYYFNVSFGTNWFGNTDKFGQGSDASHYDHFELDGQSEFALQNGYRYTARIR